MVPTGIKKLDDFLSGGIPPGILVDVFGASSTGKTQLLFQLAAISARNGLNVLYVDTTGAFRPERIVELGKRFGFEQNSLKQITVSRVTNTREQINVSRRIGRGNFPVVLIDNITDLFSYEYQKEEDISEKHSLFVKYLRNLSGLAMHNKIHIIITNMIRMADEKEVENMAGAMSLFTHVRIHLSKEPSKYRGRARWALDHGTFSYRITGDGLTDDEDI